MTRWSGVRSVYFKNLDFDLPRPLSDLPFSRLSTRVRILFSIPAVRRMVVASQIQGHGCVRTALAHTPVLVRASAREACANGRGNGLSGPPQERMPLHGRRGPTSPSNLWLGRAALVAVMQYTLWLLGSRDADASLGSGLLAAMPRCLCRRLERNSSGRCDCCAPECWRHDLSRCVWCYIILENTFRQ